MFATDCEIMLTSFEKSAKIFDMWVKQENVRGLKLIGKLRFYYQVKFGKNNSLKSFLVVILRSTADRGSSTWTVPQPAEKQRCP